MGDLQSWLRAGVVAVLAGLAAPVLATECTLGEAPYVQTIPDGAKVTLYTAPSVPKGSSCDRVATPATCKAGRVTAKDGARFAGCMEAEGFTGVNMNGAPDELDRPMLQATGAGWVRAFVNVVAAKNDVDKGKRTAGLDADKWATFRALGAEGTAKTILSLKWDFADPGLHPPLPGSPEEQAMFAFLDREILDPLAATTTIIVSGNEPFVNTLQRDWEPVAEYDGIPLVVFYQRVTAHVDQYLTDKGLRGKVKLFVGAFTRLSTDGMQTRPAVLQLMDFADKAPFVDGVDLHTHVSRLEQINSAIKFVQGHTTKPLIITEYTYIHAQRAALEAGKPLGRDFAKQWDVAADMTELDYLRCNVFHRGPGCKTKPFVSKAEWDDFLKTRSWYVDHFLLKADAMFRARGVLGVTFGLVQGEPGLDNLQPGGMPWFLGFLFSPAALGYGADGVPLPNYQNLDDFRALNGMAN